MGPIHLHFRGGLSLVETAKQLSKCLTFGMSVQVQASQPPALCSDQRGCQGQGGTGHLLAGFLKPRPEGHIALYCCPGNRAESAVVCWCSQALSRQLSSAPW